MRRLTVVGAGLAGTWLTVAARAAGIDVTVVDDTAPSGTSAALALLRPTHLPPPLRRHLPTSLAAWTDAGAAVRAGAYVTRWDRPGRKFQPRWWAVEPAELVAPKLVGWARPVSATRVDVDGATVDADAVVWCDGRGTGRYTFGVTWVNDNPDALAVPLSIHHVAPYKVLAAVRYATSARLGSSSASTPDAARAQADKLLGLAVERGLTDTTDGWRPVKGVRLQRDRLLDRPAELAGAWRWSGFHRTGFGVVPALAPDVVRQVSA